MRIISKNSGLKLAVSALLMAIPNIFNVIIISLLLFVIFGIVGVNYLKGAFFYYYMDSNMFPRSLMSKLTDGSIQGN